MRGPGCRRRMCRTVVLELGEESCVMLGEQGGNVGWPWSLSRILRRCLIAILNETWKNSRKVRNNAIAAEAFRLKRYAKCVSQSRHLHCERSHTTVRQHAIDLPSLHVEASHDSDQVVRIGIILISRISTSRIRPSLPNRERIFHPVKR